VSWSRCVVGAGFVVAPYERIISSLVILEVA
jgi:hypothetical protein